MKYFIIKLTRHAWRWSKWIKSRSFVRHGITVTDSHACHADRLTDLTLKLHDASWKDLFTKESNWLLKPNKVCKPIRK
jgi:hypothetical protein